MIRIASALDVDSKRRRPTWLMLGLALLVLSFLVMTFVIARAHPGRGKARFGDS